MPDKVILFRGFPAETAYCISPFPTKLEFRLRHGRLPYQVEEGSSTAAPKGKVPYVDLSALQNSESVITAHFGDSTLILRRLVDMGQLEDLNANLSPEQKMADLGIRALLEDKLYFYNMRERWIDNYYVHREIALWNKPLPIRVLVGMLIYRSITATLHGQGTGRFTSDEIGLFRADIWQQIDLLLKSRRQRLTSDQPFWVLGNEEPTEADATLYGFIVSALVAPSGPTSTAIVKALPNVMEYAERIHTSLFPDYDKWS
ncbi:uncharacterized protein A1O9_01810 [Exophiala aquamarina CBS 119918]|uniref:Thioredoxin-like fold domain-containing protein n=1 Tax=Exophiala aquamarina CBS 119918 TaxID=1182545 RepID=A0A072PVT8_9EURO|nr:uncharacterized protein A1O9_01810 [Exophiala aquamarina CBS 119918]KEF63832.1 hypothetical protein A1O9_01810 [Exophiala aquamarina CBS 119918]